LAVVFVLKMFIAGMWEGRNLACENISASINQSLRLWTGKKNKNIGGEKGERELR